MDTQSEVSLHTNGTGQVTCQYKLLRFCSSITVALTLASTYDIIYKSGLININHKVKLKFTLTFACAVGYEAIYWSWSSQIFGSFPKNTV